MTRPLKLRWTLAALALIAAVALTVRVVPAWNAVFGHSAPVSGSEADPTDSGVRLLGVDSYFHLRHARYVAANFPSLMRHDPWIAYPTGARVREVGLYALGTGAVAWALGAGDPGERLLQQVMAWAPAVLGAMAYPALFAGTAALWGPMAGLVAAVLLLASPGTFLDRSLLGFSDHHVAEVLLLLLLFLTMARLLPGTRAGPRAPRQAAGRGVVAALPLLVFHVTWVGAPLWLVLVGASLLVGAAAAVTRKEGSVAMVGIASCGAAFTLGILALGALYPDLIQEPAVLPRIVMAGAGITLLLPGWSFLVDRGVSWRGGSPALAGGLVLVGGIAGIAGVLLYTPMGTELWVTLTGLRTNLVAEHVTDWQQGLVRTASLPGLLAAVAPVALLIRAWRTGSWTDMAPVTLALLGMAVALSTGDFDYILAPAAAFLSAGLVVEGFRLVEGKRPWVRRAPAVALVVILAAPLVGATGPARPWRNAASADQLAQLDESWMDALHWLRSSTPDPRSAATGSGAGGSGAEEGSPPYPFQYGVLTAWDNGNVVASLAERPVLWSQGPSTVTAGLLLASADDELEDLLRDGAPLRYVVVDDRTMGPWARAKVVAAGGADRFVAPWGPVTVRGHSGTLMTFGPDFESSLAYRLYYGDGDGLGRFRLVFQSREESLTGYVAHPTQGGFDMRRERRRLETEEQRNQALAWAGDAGQVLDLGEAGLLYGVQVAPVVRIYERVEGALLVGEAPPGRKVHVAVMVRPGRDGGDRDPFLWESTADVNGAGRWEVRVPYSTQQPREEGRVATESTYRAFLLPEAVPTSGQLSSADAVLLADGIEVAEAQVQEGAVVLVPNRSGR